jgi:hypothetical protein
MPDFIAPRRVRLIVDVAKYDSRCIAGSLGTTTKYSDGFDSGASARPGGEFRIGAGQRTGAASSAVLARNA